ncbi:unnamed protein product [Chondrus crispus]|uniref:Uncharacterized protein n=1 Tax=Chondrus crispus TaxID=2769 RepID=R7QLL1_CHOCR|nr:unnamed protein product [Chondrus crispus]CDF39387.1 unnamed protein product [Chondrus crispus]|eukprot:XP_005719298.1 unnamed protein product [Chondrus crispus]
MDRNLNGVSPNGRGARGNLLPRRKTEVYRGGGGPRLANKWHPPLGCARSPRQFLCFCFCFSFCSPLTRRACRGQRGPYRSVRNSPLYSTICMAQRTLNHFAVQCSTQGYYCPVSREMLLAASLCWHQQPPAAAPKLES